MKDNNQNKELTLSDIAQLINATKTDLEAKIISSADETKKSLEAKIENSVHELATMTQKQFLVLEKKMSNVENSVEEVKSDVRELKTDMKEVKANLNKKVDKIDHNTLTYRVEKLEKNFA